MILWELLTTFFRIGFFTIGGGYAMLPLIQEEIVMRGWLTVEEFLDIVAIAEMTPGAIAVNAATFVGFRTAGILGSLVATGGIALPSLLLVILLATFWTHTRHNHFVQAFFAGIRPAVAGLIGAAALSLGVTALTEGGVSDAFAGWPIEPRSLLITILVFLAVHIKKWDPIKMIVAAGAAGVFLFWF